jgi:hypothetical protein
LSSDVVEALVLLAQSKPIDHRPLSILRERMRTTRSNAVVMKAASVLVEMARRTPTPQNTLSTSHPSTSSPKHKMFHNRSVSSDVVEALVLLAHSKPIDHRPLSILRRRMRTTRSNAVMMKAASVLVEMARRR